MGSREASSSRHDGRRDSRHEFLRFDSCEYAQFIISLVGAAPLRFAQIAALLSNGQIKYITTTGISCARTCDTFKGVSGAVSVTGRRCRRPYPNTDAQTPTSTHHNPYYTFGWVCFIYNLNLPEHHGEPAHLIRVRRFSLAK